MKSPYLRLIRFDKPVGTLLTLWPGVWGLTLGAAQTGAILPSASLCAVFGVGALAARSAGCIVNDMWDRRFDAQVARTADRPLASGELSMGQASGALLGSLGVAACMLVPLNEPAQLIAVGAVVPIGLYPLFKRFTHGAQLFLGVTFNLGALMGYAAATGSLSPAAGLLYAGSVAWTVAYDTVYAHQDKRDDAAVQLRSMALWDRHNRVPLLSAAVASVCWSAALAVQYGTWAVPAALPAAGLAVALTRVDVDRPEACGRAFRRNVHVGWLLFAGLLAANYTQEVGTAIASWRV